MGCCADETTDVSSPMEAMPLHRYDEFTVPCLARQGIPSVPQGRLVLPG